ncbi:MAG TPA: FAD-dependent oxidoreductase [Ktedonobacteraceae bacterium]|jgi:thioredoxin reductase|nr:FAD-dependent oxidoreductase [Ktedonobacteraceae bacterium]
MEQQYDLAIVGAGLSVLSAFQAGLRSERAILFDYQDAPGGFLRNALSAPGFEAFGGLLESSPISAEVTTCFGSTAVGLLPAFGPREPHVLLVRSRQGTREVRARRILIACGGLEIPREHDQIPGSRPAGVMTPVLAHQLLKRGYLPGKRMVIYGRSRYTDVTAQRLESVGVEVMRVMPPETQLVRIEGFPRLQRVYIRRGEEQVVLEADALVYGKDMMANTHWLRGSGLTTNEEGALVVDAHYQTNIFGIYAIGTVVKPSLDHSDSLRMGKEVASILNGGQG